MNYRPYIWVSTMILILLVIGIRIFGIGPLVAGDDAYNDFLAGEELSHGGDLTDSSQPFIINIYDLLLSLIAPDFALHTFVFLGPILAILSLLLVFYIYRKVGLDEDISCLSTSVILLSPIFIYMILQPAKDVFAFVFVLLSLAAFLRFGLYSLPLFILLPFVGLFHTIIAALGLFVLEKNSRRNLVIFLIMGSVSLLYYLPLYLHFGIVDIASINVHRITSLFSDLGGDMGFGIFTLILAVIGLSLRWQVKRKLLLEYTILLVFFIMAFFRTYLALYLNLVLSVLVAYAISWLWKRRWQHLQIKNLTLILILCGLLFSMVSYIDLKVYQEPDNALHASLTFLKYQEDGRVLSHPSYGNWIAYFSEKTPHFNKYETSNQSIWYVRNIETARAYFGKNHIRYIYIHPDMRDGLIWNEADEGLQFLLGNNETFDNIYSEGGFGIWRVKDEN